MRGKNNVKKTQNTRPHAHLTPVRPLPRAPLKITSTSAPASSTPTAVAMKWNLDALAAAPEETRGLNTPADGIYELSAFHAVPDKWRFSPMGDCGQVPFRGGVVRFVFFKLFGTGIVALLCAARAADRKASFGCALSAAVNAVACAHYALIWRARMQIFPRSLRQFEAPIGNPAADAKDDDERIRIQDFVVDGWRFSDWAVRAQIILSNSTHSSIPTHYTTSAGCCNTWRCFVLALRCGARHACAS